MRRAARSLLLSAICLLLAASALTSAAQTDADAPPRDPRDLARRFLGYDDRYELPQPTPIYDVGEKTDFYVPKRDADTPQRVQATLAAVSSDAYFWVEDGIAYDEEAMGVLAAQIDGLFTSLRLRSLYGDTSVQLEAGAVPLPEDLLDMPDVDFEPRIFILYTQDVPFESVALYNWVDGIPAALLPAGTSNQHELILVDTTLFTGAQLTDAVFVSALIDAYYAAVLEHNNPTQAPWLRAALTEINDQLLNGTQPPASDIAAFLDAPDTSLLAVGDFVTRQPVNGGHILFLNYFFQRYGGPAFSRLYLTPGAGIDALDAALSAEGIVDPVTSDPVTARAAYADFAMTNILNLPFGDGRYVHTQLGLRQGVRARFTELAGFGDTVLADRDVAQFGTNYLLINNDSDADATVIIGFEGEPSTPTLPLPDAEADNAFYWSGRALNANPTLTRAVDLRAALTATLRFDAWYGFGLPEGLHYAYVSVSSDGGDTWTIVPTTHTTETNPFGAAYGPGLTGYSSPDGPRPFPILGIVVGGDGLTVSAVSPGGPAEAAGIRAEDRIIGYEGQPWQRVPNLIAIQADYAPGEVIELLVERGDETLDIPVTLGAHPTRRLPPAAEWQTQQADLTPFAGQQVLLRFEVVVLPGLPHDGLAIDNLEIAEVNFADGGDQADAWEMVGWAAMRSRTAQQFLVQAFTGPTETSAPAVETLIGIDDPATSGEWRFGLVRGQQLMIAVSGLNDDTAERARYSMSIDIE